MRLVINLNKAKGDPKIINKVFREIKFGLSQGMNRTISKVREHKLSTQYAATFDKRNSQFFNLVHTISNSHVSQFDRYGMLIGAISRNETPPPTGAKRGRVKGKRKGKVDTSFMVKHVRGGNRTPSGAKLAIPFSTSSFQPKRTRGSTPQSGRIRAADRVSRLYPQKQTFVGKSKRSGKSVLFKRQRKGKPVPLYHFQTSIKNKPKYNPYIMAKASFEGMIETEVVSAISKNLKSARIKI